MRGDLSLHHLNLIHGSGPNRSDRDRIGVVFRYLPAYARQDLPHHEAVLVRGEDRWGNFDLMAGAPDRSLAEGIALESQLHRRARQVRSLDVPDGDARP